MIIRDQDINPQTMLSWTLCSLISVILVKVIDYITEYGNLKLRRWIPLKLIPIVSENVNIIITNRTKFINYFHL